MKDLKYKIRASKSEELVRSCGRKVNNKLEWDIKNIDDDKYSDGLKKIAIEIYNHTEYGYKSPEVKTNDLENGKMFESEAVKYYDTQFGTDYFSQYEKQREFEQGKSFAVSNAFATGTRDFGNNIKTIDCKTSTDKNVFDIKCHSDLITANICQLNTYKILYGSDEIEIYYYLASKSQNEIDSLVWKFRSIDPYQTDEFYDNLQDYYTKLYTYDDFSGYKRAFRKEVPIIDNWEDILYGCVAKMNRFIQNILIPNDKE